MFYFISIHISNHYAIHSGIWKQGPIMEYSAFVDMHIVGSIF